MDEATKQRIEEFVSKNRVMLFMKGTKLMPMCGFSGQVAQILNTYGIEYQDFNVLDDMDIRQGIKEYADWPTIPQLYVDGEFIGGCDIVMEMHESGELEPLVKGEGAAKGESGP